MADKRQHLAKMNAKGLEDAVTDDDARAMIESQGGRSLFLVEAVHGPYTTAVDGAQTINLLPGVVVLVPEDQAKPVRDLLRGLALGGPQALVYEDAGDAFVPPVEQSAAAVQAAADDHAAAAADPEAPLPSGDEPDADGPWPGDEGYEAPGAAADPSGDAAADDLAAKRARGTRGKAAGA